MRNRVQSYRDLDVYRAAFELQQIIFESSKEWPGIEKYALTDQVRRSSRSIGANLAEAWAKRGYRAHFLSKLTDSDGELQETLHWLESARACGYLNGVVYVKMLDAARSVGSKLGAMIASHESFCSPV